MPPMPCSNLDSTQQQTLLRAARESIEAGLNLRRTVHLPNPLDPDLAAHGASFVTLHKRNSLRGCIGSLEATIALIEDVMHNARAAALRDPRFPPLDHSELSAVEISISVLQAPQPMYVSCPEDLYEQLEAHRTGVIVEHWQHDQLTHKATFLPSVWEQVSSAERFIRELKRKAGIEADYWSSELRWFSYHTQQFCETRQNHHTEQRHCSTR